MTLTDFERRLTDSLDHLAETVVVAEPNPATFRSARPTEPTRSDRLGPGARGRFLLVAACLLVAGAAAAAIGIISQLDGESTQSTAPASDGAGEAETATVGTELVIWLRVRVGPDAVDEVRRALFEDGRATAIRYVDRDATYADFLDFFADEPELVALVEPEDLPTSFRVMVSGDDVEDFITWAGALPAVQAVESFADSRSPDRDRLTEPGG